MPTSLLNQNSPSPYSTDIKSETHITSTNQLPQKLYAEVVVNIPLNKVFHYSVSPHLRENLTAGMRVKIPFGNKIIAGFCVGFTHTPFTDKTKDIIGVIDKIPLIDDLMLKITKWLSSHYCCGWGEAISAVIPPVVRSKKKEKWNGFVRRNEHTVTLDHDTLLNMKVRAPKQAKVLEILLEHPTEISAKELIRISGCKMPGLRQLEKKGFVILENKLPDAANTPRTIDRLQQHLTLTQEQQNAFDIINKKLEQPKPGIILLHGITGSGKTELYLQTITKALEYGRKAIYLVPEISLTPQTIQRIKARFDKVAVLHSNLLGTVHQSQWNDIKEGKVDIVVGARSSIFAPLKNVGLIIIDEEHENTYKQENIPRYNARDIAILRATCENALVIMGTATPSLESYSQALNGSYEKIVLSKRIGERQLPPVDIVDMGEEVRKRRGYNIISQRLQYYMNQSLARNEQVILFLNRRGFAPYIHCKRCGFVLKCHRCDIPMTFHKKFNTTLCHYCHAEAHPPESCPDCLANTMNYRGFGTEKIEDEIKNKFPNHTIIRMDSDSMRVRDAHEKALTAFERGEFQILLGTQMIAKGLDFPNVTLVGVISADTILNLPDFRASERTFQLISQVAGRTGRGTKGGRVVVQSFNPRHYSITYAAAHDYEGFARKELEYRKQLNYPPFGKLARIVFRSPQENKAKEKSSIVGDKLKELAKINGNHLEILGPSPAPMTKINNLFRWHILLKTQDHASIHTALHGVADMLKPTKSVQTMVDVDPYMML
ncbi:MAG: primosomal protein N' [Candidatus Brocadia sp. AMX2]|uniref:Replication restart protein PriA n=1 Tax=Candidatus Brocadia sinica JPN1 TaxID=1197129 RepID=A0ABQ0JYZ1_9BACT|nr:MULTISPECIES: primosomal protein N' [Brocadia]KXK31731.1 MAG: primosomal protein N' [Candidatus Brocadia sinica]MBC6932206.1 primosomal protein N' [Candidatus Brocadia sp.]MBL1168478.1 primosomal protein N' [Candidatus Brocadia sp. AMX1]NOG40238.1 primosomal protein N' [Planctomycetota bacterium]KAA0243647.1 MAG: primosomal protein N' [Candidatus Brocadia sp. AMX2]